MHAGTDTYKNAPWTFLLGLGAVAVVLLGLNKLGVIEGPKERQVRIEREAPKLMSPRELVVMGRLFSLTQYVEREMFVRNPFKDGVQKYVIGHRESPPDDPNYLFCSSRDRIFLLKLFDRLAPTAGVHGLVRRDLQREQDKFCG